MRTSHREGKFKVLCAGALGCLLLLSGCIGNLPHALTDAVLNQNDPETVRSGVPTYLILLDTLIADDPDDDDLLRAGAQLYAFYATLFNDDPQRAARMTDRARRYGEAALCAADGDACGLTKLSYEDFDRVLVEIDDDELPELYALAVSWLSWMEAHRSDWSALADLPKLEKLFERIVSLDDQYENGNPHLYLGILKTLRPPALGGKPEEGRLHFDRALEISGGTALGYQVAYARHYARMVFDRDLHDRLLNEVLNADPEQPGLTLLNVLAQREARELLLDADDFF